MSSVGGFGQDCSGVEEAAPCVPDSEFVGDILRGGRGFRRVQGCPHVLPEGFCRFGIGLRQAKWRGTGGVPNSGALSLRGGTSAATPAPQGAARFALSAGGGSSAPAPRKWLLPWLPAGQDEKPEQGGQDGRWEGRNKGKLHPLPGQVGPFNSLRGLETCLFLLLVR